MYNQQCTSFEARDPGDVELVEEVPYQREQLGSAVGDEPPKERFDIEAKEEVEVEEAEEEEEAETDGE